MLTLYKKEDSILLAGPYPKPLGGVSVHTKRLYYLLKDKGYKVKLYKLNKRLVPGVQWVGLLLHLIFKRYDTVHMQIFEPIFHKVLIWICKIKNMNLVLTIHNPRVTSQIKSYLNLLNNTGTIVLVGDHILEQFKKKGIYLATSIKVIPSYLPPNEEEEEAIISSYPPTLINFLKRFDNQLLVSAYKLILTEKGIDLYGIDKSIKLLKELLKENNSIGLIIAIGDEKYNKKYYHQLKLTAKADGIIDNIFFLENQKEIWPLFKKINLFLRPTCYDGFGISVAEAINMGCSSIASDVCKRADGAIIYDYNNPDELLLKAKNVLFNK